MSWLRERVQALSGALAASFTGWRWVGLLAIMAIVAWLGLRGLPDGRLHVYFLDVGQGDAILIRAPDGRQILVDGGPSPAALLNELGDVLPFWDRSLDLVVLTHPDQDHMAGLIPLVARYRIRQVLDSPQSATDPAATPWLESLQQAGIPGVHALRGMRLRIGELVMTILNPDQDPPTDTATDGNNNAVVIRLDYGERSLLLTSDAQQPAEADMLAANLPLRADVIKVGHHGSREGTSGAFLDAVAPQIAVIQVGADNRFGHPSPEVLGRLAGTEILRTDLRGRIEAISDGKRLWMKTER